MVTLPAVVSRNDQRGDGRESSSNTGEGDEFLLNVFRGEATDGIIVYSLAGVA